MSNWTWEIFVGGGVFIAEVSGLAWRTYCLSSNIVVCTSWAGQWVSSTGRAVVTDRTRASYVRFITWKVFRDRFTCLQSQTRGLDATLDLIEPYLEGWVPYFHADNKILDHNHLQQLQDLVFHNIYPKDLCLK